MLLRAYRQLLDSTSFFEEGNNFQKRRVWSPEPVRMLSSSGDFARQSTLQEWPSRVASFCMFLAFQTMMELREYPWVVTSSLVEEENSMLQTWEPESIDCMQFISTVFHSLMDLSVDPPPVASSELLCGDQAKALTAAVWSVSLPIYFPILGSQIITRLSLPPEASSPLSQDHFSPHIYCWCPSNRWQTSFCLMSQMIISLSFDPEATQLPLRETSITPTLPRWFLHLAISFLFSTSIIRILPVSSPTANPLPHLTLEMYPSTSFSASLPLELHTQTALSRTTLIMSSLLQSSSVVQKSSLSLGALSTLQEVLGNWRGTCTSSSSFLARSQQKSRYPPRIILDLQVGCRLPRREDVSTDWQFFCFSPFFFGRSYPAGYAAASGPISKFSLHLMDPTSFMKRSGAWVFLPEVQLWSRLRLERVKKGSGEATLRHGVCVFSYIDIVVIICRDQGRSSEKTKASNILSRRMRSGLCGSWGELPRRVFRFSMLTFSPSLVFLMASKALMPALSPCFFLLRFFSTFSPSLLRAFSFSSQAELCCIQMFFFSFRSSSFRMNLSISSESTSSSTRSTSASSSELSLSSKMSSVMQLGASDCEALSSSQRSLACCSSRSTPRTCRTSISSGMLRFSLKFSQGIFSILSLWGMAASFSSISRLYSISLDLRRAFWKAGGSISSPSSWSSIFSNSSLVSLATLVFLNSSSRRRMVSSQTKTVLQMSLVEHLTSWILVAMRMAAPQRLEGRRPWHIQSRFIRWISLMAVSVTFMALPPRSRALQQRWMQREGSMMGSWLWKSRNLNSFRKQRANLKRFMFILSLKSTSRQGAYIARALPASNAARYRRQPPRRSPPSSPSRRTPSYPRTA